MLRISRNSTSSSSSVKTEYGEKIDKQVQSSKPIQFVYHKTKNELSRSRSATVSSRALTVQSMISAATTFPRIQSAAVSHSATSRCGSKNGGKFVLKRTLTKTDFAHMSSVERRIHSFLENSNRYII
jgi:hypothetical protein